MARLRPCPKGNRRVHARHLCPAVGVFEFRCRRVAEAAGDTQPYEVSEETQMLAFRRGRSAADSARVASATASETSGPMAVDAVLRATPAELKSMVASACESAGAATNIGWITHDVREVADSTATIVSSVEALANTIS